MTSTNYGKHIKISLEYLESTGAPAKESITEKTMNVSTTYAAIIPARNHEKNSRNVNAADVRKMADVYNFIIFR
jgi:hypothetical protein